MSRLGLICVLALTVGLGACDDDDESSSTSGPTTTEVTAAAVTSTGDGLLVVHPSAEPAWAWALEAPVRIAEHAGGSANWNWARISIFRDGQEVERAEIGSDGLSEAGVSTIAANSAQTYTLVFRLNSNVIDFFILELSFTDLKDGREFPSGVPFETFTGVGGSLAPLSEPRDEVEELGAG